MCAATGPFQLMIRDMNHHSETYAEAPPPRLVQPWTWPLLAAAATSFIALFPMPYGYFEFLRWAVFSAAIYVCILSYKRSAFGWLLVGAPLIVLFSPARFLYFEVGTWKMIDLAAAIALAGAAFFMRDEIREDEDSEQVQ